MAQANDNVTGQLMQAFKLPVNGATELIASATGVVVSSTPSLEGQFKEFVSDLDCFIALGLGTATIPTTGVAGVAGALPLMAGVAKVYYVPKGGVVSAIGLTGFKLHVTNL